MQTFMSYWTVFALSYFEFEGNSEYKPSGASWRSNLSEGFLRYDLGDLYLERLRHFLKFFMMSKIQKKIPELCS